jgi:very-short-patch-repair endonuclease
MTPPELRLWNILRTSPEGFKFRRQHPIGPYVLDFFCSAAALAIEVDGEAHAMGNNPQRDIKRDSWCAARGVKTLRFAAKDLLHEDAAVVAAILDVCRERSPSTASRSPSPAKAGEERSAR